MVDRGDEQPRGDAAGFLRVVECQLAAVGCDAVRLAKQDDDPRCIGEVRFVFVGAERREGIEPVLRRSTVVELPLLIFGCGPDARLERLVRYRDERPRLLVQRRLAPCRQCEWRSR